MPENTFGATMPLSAKHRSISIGKLLVRPPKNTSAPTDLFSDIDPRDILASILKTEHSVVLGGDETEKRIGILKSDQFAYGNQDFSVFIIYYADKEIPPSSFLDYATRQVRTEDKSEEEGGVYSGHLVLCRHNSTNELMFALERVPGVTISSTKRLVQSYLKNDPIVRSYERVIKRKKANRIESKNTNCMVDFLGRESESIRQALETGTFEGIEYRLEYKKKSTRMEVPELEKAKESASWRIEKRVSIETSKKIIKTALGHMFGGEEDGTRRYFLQITTNDEVTKTTEITDLENPLEQAFIHNERVRGFPQDLPQYHDDIHVELCEKIAKKMLE